MAILFKFKSVNWFISLILFLFLIGVLAWSAIHLAKKENSALKSDGKNKKEVENAGKTLNRMFHNYVTLKNNNTHSNNTNQLNILSTYLKNKEKSLNLTTLEKICKLETNKFIYIQKCETRE